MFFVVEPASCARSTVRKAQDDFAAHTYRLATQHGPPWVSREDRTMHRTHQRPADEAEDVGCVTFGVS